MAVGETGKPIQKLEIGEKSVSDSTRITGLERSDRNLQAKLKQGSEKTTDDVVESSINSSCQSKPLQVHHFATNKNKNYKRLFEEIADKYGLNLDDDWNKELLPHIGRHLNLYHDFILERIMEIDQVANGNVSIFLRLYKEKN